MMEALPWPWSMMEALPWPWRRPGVQAARGQGLNIQTAMVSNLPAGDHGPCEGQQHPDIQTRQESGTQFKSWLTSALLGRTPPPEGDAPSNVDLY